MTRTVGAKGAKHRCSWAESDSLMRAYHDSEWGVPEYDGRALWEKLMLDGVQAGLSWAIILRKRPAFRKAFKNFDPEKVARFGETDITRLLEDAGIERDKAATGHLFGRPGPHPARLALRTTAERTTARGRRHARLLRPGRKRQAERTS